MGKKTRRVGESSTRYQLFPIDTCPNQAATGSAGLRKLRHTTTIVDCKGNYENYRTEQVRQLGRSRCQ